LAKKVGMICIKNQGDESTKKQQENKVNRENILHIIDHPLSIDILPFF